MSCLGTEMRFSDRSRPWAGWQSPGIARPLFLIGKPYAYEIALAHGGVSEGLPALRPEYHANYYGAYFRDPDGNKLCVACHAPEV